MALPIDSMFPDRIVSHVPPNSYSGTLAIYDSSGSYSGGSLIVTRPSVWTTLSEIWDNVRVTEQHRLTGYRNGPGNTIDSTWQTTATYSGQHDMNIAGTMFGKTAHGLNYAIPQANYSYSLLQLEWDTVSQTAQVVFYKNASIPATTYHSLDTVWYSNNNQILQALLPIDQDIEFILPDFGYQIIEDSTDASGLVYWQETTNGTATSGSFDLILKR